MALIEAVKNIFREENNMVELEAPVSVSQTTRGEERRGEETTKLKRLFGAWGGSFSDSQSVFQRRKINQAWSRTQKTAYNCGTSLNRYVYSILAFLSKHFTSYVPCLVLPVNQMSASDFNRWQMSAPAVLLCGWCSRAYHV